MSFGPLTSRLRASCTVSRFRARAGLRASALASALAAALAACAGPAARPVAGERIIDDFGDTLVIARPPARIVSLNPASTEILFTIGAGQRVVGRTSWDAWPDAARAVPDLGPGLRPNVEAVLAAKPDLVLLYAAQDNRAAARALRAAGVATLTLRVDRIADFARATTLLGRVLGDTAAAATLRDSVLATVSRVAGEARAARAAARTSAPSVAWPLGERPLYVIGGSSFLGELIDSAGGRNAFGDLAQPSPTVAFEELVRRDPDVLVVGAAAAARIATDARWRQLRAVRSGRLVIADSVRTGRPGPRLGEAVSWLRDALAAAMATAEPARAPR
ncbi:MAG: ABC transporter substrate-binding protein [Gemmatimonadota bacterium]|nr:helical backbone metal receptor [Gemmatimonadota bacterium]